MLVVKDFAIESPFSVDADKPNERAGDRPEHDAILAFLELETKSSVAATCFAERSIRVPPFVNLRSGVAILPRVLGNLVVGTCCHTGNWNRPIYAKAAQREPRSRAAGFPREGRVDS